MKAAQITGYGLDQITLSDQPDPEPGPGEVLVRVAAASINPADLHLATGTPLMVRLTEGLRAPKQPIVGSDGAGLIEAVGPDVTDYRVGDRVFGKFVGAFAELAVASVDRIAQLPDTVTFDQGAALPIAGVTALQAIEKGEVAGKSVVVNGASGGVGHFAVQLAKAAGAASVTGVCSGRNVELVRLLGADQVVDYTSTDFTDTTHDVVIECIGGRTAADYFRGLSDNGRVVLVSAEKSSKVFGPMFPMARLTARFAMSRRDVSIFVSAETHERLAALVTHVATGQVTPHIDREFPLCDVVAAYDYIATSRARGKVLIRP